MVIYCHSTGEERIIKQHLIFQDGNDYLLICLYIKLFYASKQLNGQNPESTASIYGGLNHEPAELEECGFCYYGRAVLLGGKREVKLDIWRF